MNVLFKIDDGSWTADHVLNISEGHNLEDYIKWWIDNNNKNFGTKWKLAGNIELLGDI